MSRSIITRLILVAIIVAVGLSLTFALDENPSLALSDLPEGHGARMGQSHGIYFADETSTNGTLYVSQDSRIWRALPVDIEGAVTHVAAVDPESDVIYVATDQGLYATTDGGRQWAPVKTPIDKVAALVPVPGIEDMIYAASEDGRLFRLTDGGTSAMRVNVQSLPGTLHDLALLPGSGEVLLASTDEGVFRSESAGSQWTQINEVPPATRILPSRHDPGTVYLATRESGLYRSTDAGRSWEVASDGLGTVAGTGLTITAVTEDPEQAGVLYVATGYASEEQSIHPAALYMSPDGGALWIRVTTFNAEGPVVTALLPEVGASSGVRAVTAEGVSAYTLDADQALEMLHSGDRHTRLDGAKILSVAAVPTQLETLLPFLFDEDNEIAYFAARAVGTIGTDEATREAAEIVAGDAATIVKLRALMALEMIADPATVPVLSSAFQDDTLAGSAASALAATGNDEAWMTLVATLGDEELTPQRQAAMAAFESYREGAVEPLLAALSDTNPLLRANAATVLGWMGDAQAIPALRELLDDADPRVRAATAFALGEVRDTESSNRLARMAREDESAEVRQAAEAAVARASRAPQAPPIEEMLEGEVAPTLADRLNIDGTSWLKTLILTLTAALSLLVLAVRPRARITI